MFLQQRLHMGPVHAQVAGKFGDLTVGLRETRFQVSPFHVITGNALCIGQRDRPGIETGLRRLCLLP